jgi:hypothetical protein
MSHSRGNVGGVEEEGAGSVEIRTPGIPIRIDEFDFCDSSTVMRFPRLIALNPAGQPASSSSDLSENQGHSGVQFSKFFAWLLWQNWSSNSSIDDDFAIQPVWSLVPATSFWMA